MSLYILSAIFVSVLFSTNDATLSHSKRFEVTYEWDYVNFTWPDEKSYNEAVNNKNYIPQNNAIAGIKFYNDNFYIALPRLCSDGSPVTLGSFKKEESKSNILVTPFPDWETNDISSNPCDKLVNVQSMEIDNDGIMWVLDGVRLDPKFSECPVKLVLFDLNNNNKIVLKYVFNDAICLSNGGFLNDIVIDDTDGVYAYMTDDSVIDPGLIVFSKKEIRSWKFRDASMFAKISQSDFEVDGVKLSYPTPVDGIALSAKKTSGPRYVYYSTVSGVDLYSINTDILKKEENVAQGAWRRNVTFIGHKQAQSDGMVIDSENNLYYGLLPLYAAGKWNTLKNFITAHIIDRNRKTMNWADSWCFDDSGYVYLLANQLNKFVILGCPSEISKTPVFRIMKYFTDTASYLKG